MWFESKNFTSYAMPMGASNIHFLLDFYHALGCFWAIENGLYRHSSQEHCRTWLFPSLVQYSNNYIATKIKSYVQSYLPWKNEKDGVEISQELKKEYSGKSLREAAITLLIANHQVSHRKACRFSVPDVSLCALLDYSRRYMCCVWPFFWIKY